MDSWLRDVLTERLTASRPRLFAFDYDGTLAAPVDDPDAESSIAGNREKLFRLSNLSGVHAAVVSGRSIRSLEEMIGLPEKMIYSGNHGYEILAPQWRYCHPGAAAAAGAVAACMDELKTTLVETPGLIFEEKQYSGALFFKASSAEMLSVIAPLTEATVNRYTDLRYLRGSRVYEICPAVSWDKGEALVYMAARLGVAEEDILFAGDDVNDEPAFERLPRAMTIRVGEGASAANFRLSGQASVSALLDFLLEKSLKNV